MRKENKKTGIESNLDSDPLEEAWTLRKEQTNYSLRKSTAEAYALVTMGLATVLVSAGISLYNLFK